VYTRHVGNVSVGIESRVFCLVWFSVGVVCKDVLRYVMRLKKCTVCVVYAERLHEVVVVSNACFETGRG